MMPEATPAIANLPRHVAIIMDGNGRWARKRHLPRAAGHVAGVSAVRKVVRAAIEIGLENLTLYAFSSENWKRPLIEVNHLMGLVPRLFRKDVEELHAAQCPHADHRQSLRVPRPIFSAMIEDGEKPTAHNTGLNLTFAFDYGAQEEIAPRRAMARAARKGSCDPDAITPEFFAAQLSTGGVARSRPRHSHRRRAPAEQFSALAIGLCRARFPRHAVAGFLAGARIPRRDRSQSRIANGASARWRRKRWHERRAHRAYTRRPRAWCAQRPATDSRFRWTGSRGSLFGYLLAALAVAATLCGRHCRSSSLFRSAAPRRTREWHRLFAPRDFLLPTAITVVAADRLAAGSC